MNISFRNITLLLSYFVAFQVFIVAQTPLQEAARTAEISPAWPGCEPQLPECTKSRMADFIAANLQIPLEAKAESAGGVVMMEFVVEKNGMIGEVRPLHNPGFGLGEEATRVLTLMKSKKIKWTPAEEDGKKIAFRYITPVSFNIPGPPKEKSKAEELTENPASQIYYVVDEMPRFAGCEQAAGDSIDCTFIKVVNHIKANLIYPDEAYKKRVEGQVEVEFIVDPTGAIIEPTLIQGIGFGCDQEAIRILSTMPAWIPGMHAGQPVAVRMNLPIVFQLPKQKEE